MPGRWSMPRSFTQAKSTRCSANPARLPPFVPSTIYLGTAHERKSRVSRYPFHALSGLDQMTLLSRQQKVLSALIRSDKAKSLIGIVPFHRAQLLDGRAVTRWIRRSLRPRTPRRLLRRGAGIHADDLGHLRPLRSWAGAYLKRRARRYAAVAAALRDAYMQEGIAGA